MLRCGRASSHYWSTGAVEDSCAWTLKDVSGSQAHTTLKQDYNGIVEPKNRVVGLLIEALLHSPRGMELCVEVMNTTDKDLNLAVGSIVGQFVPVDEVLTTVPAAANYKAFRTCQTEEKPPHAQEHLSLIYRCGGSGWQNVKNPGFNFRVTKYHFYQELNLSS